MTWVTLVPGVVALLVAVLGFWHNSRTLKAAQPKSEADRQATDIATLRGIIAELREARAADRAEFQAEIDELRQQLADTVAEHQRQLARLEALLAENSITLPAWWPHRPRGGHPS